jgi:hypothetical protein
VTILNIRLANIEYKETAESFALNGELMATLNVCLDVVKDKMDACFIINKEMTSTVSMGLDDIEHKTLHPFIIDELVTRPMFASTISIIKSRPILLFIKGS